jgi:uncharacterized protein
MVSLHRPVRAWIPAILFAFVAAFLLPRSAPAQVPAVPLPGATGAAPATAIEKPFLWRIEAPVPSYLFGTIHVPDERVTTLPPVVQQVLDSVDALYTEIPMDMASLMKAAAAAQLPKGTVLKDIVGDELHGRLRTFVEGKGFKMAMFDRMQPWSIGAQLTMLDQMKQMAEKQPLDMMLATQARKAKKKVGALETLDEQFGVFADLTAAEQTTFLGKSLDRIEKDAAAGKNTIDTLIAMYLRGDEQALAKEINDYELGDPELQAKLLKRLLDDRNLRMVDRLVRHLQEEPRSSHFFAVGAAHYPGELGILPLLQKRGYRLTRIDLSIGQAAAARDAAAIDAEIAALEQQLATLRARRERLVPAGAGR